MIIAAEEVDGFLDADIIVDAGGLELHPDEFLDTPRLFDGIDTADFDAAAVRLAQPLNHFHRGGLARAVRPQDAEYLPLLHA